MYSCEYYYHPSSDSIDDVDSIKDELTDRLWDELDEYDWMEEHYSFNELAEMLLDDNTTGDELRDRMRDECWDRACEMICDAENDLDDNEGELCLDYLDTYYGMKCSETKFV